MSAGALQPVREDERLYVPADWKPASTRDVALDLVRGLAMVVLVVNHTALESPLRDTTRMLFSAAEVLVLVSGVVAGMVFGRRWLSQGARATTGMLLRRARKLYLASVVVVALVGLATFVPGLATEALSQSPRVPGVDSYSYDGWARTLLAIVTLEAGPWQFNILGFFVTVIAAAPLVLWALARGWWVAVVVGSVGLYVAGRAGGVDVLPSQSERAFPLLIWQLLFVGGMVAGWHREPVVRWARPRLRAIAGATFGIALVLLVARELAPEHFHKTSLEPLRLLAMTSAAGALYLALRHGERLLGPLLLPLGRNSFYVFIMHVFVCLTLASLPLTLTGIPAVLAQVTCVGILWLMVRNRFLFRYVPR